MSNPISKTAYFSLACRYWYSPGQPKVLCQDALSSSFMNEEAHAVANKFKHLNRVTAGLATRHHMMDELITEYLSKNPSATIINVGCGFDTRPYRHNGGSWVEIDEPELINRKNEVLPTSDAKNTLTRVSIEFGKDSLKEKLAPFKTNGKVLVLLEGIVYYLTKEQKQSMLKVFQELFPVHTLFCDMLTPAIVKISGDLMNQLESLGTGFQDMSYQPESVFLDVGYKRTKWLSVVLYQAETKSAPFPAWLVKYFLGSIRKGNIISIFEYPNH